MQIHCTKKMLDELQIVPSASIVDYNPLFSWRGHMVTINRRKTLVLICELNRYVIVLHGLKAKDIKEIDKRITEAIRNTLLKGGVNPDVVKCYLAEAGAIVFAKNSDRTQTARLNKACEEVQFSAHEWEAGYSDIFGVKASSYLVGDGKGGYFYPYEKMLIDLEQLGIQPIIKCRAFMITVTLKLLSYNAVRQLIVPVDMTFTQLHKVLQIAFEWDNYHLYDFMLFEQEGQAQPNVELVMDVEDMEYRNDNARMMEGVKLSEYLPQYKHIIYNYDFGDRWVHEIKVTNVYEDYPELLPLLIAGEGNTPPEDVGGIGGYEEFLKVIADPTHEEHRHLSAWGSSQGYGEFNFDMISHRVKYARRW